jgi:hypothetical protein
MSKPETVRSYSYLEYMTHFAAVVAMPEPPVLPDNVKGDFRKLNLQRMDKWNKIYEPSPDSQQKLAHILSGLTWYVIADLNCGDCAQSLPVIAKVAQIALIELKIILKDDHPEIMDHYLSNGSRSVPKLIAQTSEGNELFTWGPRPANALRIYTNYRDHKDTMAWEDFEKELHLWYARNKGVETESEIVSLLCASAASA